MKKVCLDSICTKRTSTLRQKDLLPQGGYPVYGASGIVGYLDYYQFEEDYLSIIKDGAGVGRVQLCRGKSSVLGTLQPIIPKASVNISYLRFLLSELHLESYASGATIPHIYFRDYGKHIVALPDCEGQAFISCLFEVILTQIGNAERIIFKLDELIKSHFIEMFDQPQKALPMVAVEDLAAAEKNALKAGPFGSALKKDSYVAEGYAVYGQEQVISGDETKILYHIPESKYEQLASCRVRPGDVLISLVGTAGKVLVLTDRCEEGIINPRLVKITFDQSRILPRFFAVYFGQEETQLILQHNSHGQTMNVLNLGMIRSLRVPVPSLSEQKTFLEFVKSVEAMKATTRQRLDRLNTLYDSLAQQYFAQ